ncbi:MAG: primosomal protein N' [Clostridia bacterium]|nr:primosomal protein N' [Clostridia bacterium]
MIAEVIVEVSSAEVDKVFDYKIPELLHGENIVGYRVLIPFGPRKIEGYVISQKDTSKVADNKLKEIIKLIDEKPVILLEMISLMNFMAEKFHLKNVDVLRLFIPAEMRGDRIRPLFFKTYRLNQNFDFLTLKIPKNAKKQQEIIDYIKKNEIIDTDKISDFSLSSIKKLEEIGVLISEKTQKLRNPYDSKNNFKNESGEIKHTSTQVKVLSEIKDNGTYLLHGVTGSGKTEVYMTVIERMIEKQKTAIMLVPEISLTPQVLGIFKKRFGDMVAILHSKLSAGERFDEWTRLMSGEAKIAVGPRSAIFAPLQNLGVIIIDEEHDESYISESNPRFNTFEVANYRAKQNDCALILGSATPSIETFYKTQTGDIKLLELPTRVNGRDMPKIEIVDMLGEIRNGNTGIFSNRLLNELNNCIENKKQAMLFLNRRGYTSFMMCRDCGYVAKCSDCDVSLVFHKAEGRLKCHYCGKQFKALTVCPECGNSHIREGAIGTEQVSEALRKIFPDVKILRMDNDTTRNKDAHLRILNEFNNTKPALLVGTQMIAKGHDFEDVTLVGIVDADQSLYQSHYKSAERTFALLTQVSGRAGRSKDEGKIILQTYSPKKYVYNQAANYNYKGFYEKEINLRKTTKFPPFSTIIRLLFTGNNLEEVQKITKSCFDEIKKIKEEYKDEFYYFDAMKSPINRIKAKFRFQILMRLSNQSIDKIVKLLYNVVDKNKSTKVLTFVEINPNNLN